MLPAHQIECVERRPPAPVRCARAAPARSLALLTSVLGSLVFGLVLYVSTATPAYAAEGGSFTGVLVKPGETADEVSAVFGGATVNGRVDGDIRVVSGVLVVRGPVTGDVRSGLGAVEIDAPIRGDVESGFGDVRVDSLVYGDVDVARGDLVLGPGARIYGHVFVADGRVIRESDFAVRGATVTGADLGTGHDPLDRLDLGLAVKAATALAFVACSIPVAAMSRGRVAAAARAERAEFGLSLFLGVAGATVVAVSAAVLAISIVGIPLLLLLVPAYLALALFGAITSAYYVGRGALVATKLPNRRPVWVTVVGTILASAAFMIPTVGNIVPLFLVLPGTGAVILAVYRARFRLNAPHR